MRRTDLKVGVAYYYVPSPNWAEPKYGDGGGKKAIVLSLDAPNGEVLVRVQDFPVDGASCAREMAVLPAYLRGPWEQISAQVAAYVRQRDERSRQARAARNDRAAAAKQACRRASDLGFAASVEYGGDGSAVWLPESDLQRLLDAYEAAQTRRGDPVA